MANKPKNIQDIFQKQKEQNLSAADLSRKGSIDEPIIDLVSYINSLDQYFTTSSCSGRTIIYEENTHIDQKKKGCKWLYTTHGMTDLLEATSTLSNIEANAIFKFEPFILHVQCRSLEDARLLHEISVSSGYRNSGITVGTKGKIMAAVRSTQCLEAPLSHNGKLLVEERYISYLSELANDKMKENLTRIDRFFENLKASMILRSETETESSEERKRRHPFKNRATHFPNQPAKENSNVDPFLLTLDECTMDSETGLLSIIYSDDS